jgi:hypothetical protein
MPGVPRARVSQMRKGRISAKSLWVDEHHVNRVEARRAHVGLCGHGCSVGDVLRRHGAPGFIADGRDRQRRLGRTEKRKIGARVRGAAREGERWGRGVYDARGQLKSSTKRE